MKTLIQIAVLWLATMLSLVVSAQATDKQPLIAVAASLRLAAEDLAKDFEKRTGQPVSLTFGATGNFVRQIEQGAPFALFLSADEDSVERLVAGGHTQGRGQVFVRGAVSIVVNRNSGIVFDGSFAGLAALLKSGAIKRFAIANPDLAPYGRAAREALQKSGLWDALQSRLVVAENVGQAAQYVATGAAEAGITAASLAGSPEMAGAMLVFQISAADYSPIRQAMVLLKSAGTVAQNFHSYLLSPPARAILEARGFVSP